MFAIETKYCRKQGKLEACLRLFLSKIWEAGRNILSKTSDHENMLYIMVYYATVYMEFLVASEIFIGIFGM